MSAVQSPYHYTQKGRGLYSMIKTGFAAVLAALFFFTRDPIFTAVGVFLIVLVFSGIYAFIKGETWSMTIEDGVLSWSYARWPKSSGRIDLSTVRAVVVDDCSSNLVFTFLDGSTRKIKFFGYGSRLRDYLVLHFPHVRVEFVEGT